MHRVRTRRLLQEGSLSPLLQRIQPDEIYDLAIANFAGAFWDETHLTGSVNDLGATNIQKAVRMDVALTEVVVPDRTLV